MFTRKVPSPFNWKIRFLNVISDKLSVQLYSFKIFLCFWAKLHHLHNNFSFVEVVGSCLVFLCLNMTLNIHAIHMSLALVTEWLTSSENFVFRQVSWISTLLAFNFSYKVSCFPLLIIGIINSVVKAISLLSLLYCLS